MTTQMSISQVKRDISELVKRVSYGGERIILTSQGKPKAALISIEDYERLLKSEGRATALKNGWQKRAPSPTRSRNAAADQLMWILLLMLPKVT